MLANKCEHLNEAFNHWIVHRTPFITVKAAMTLDGKIATANGESKWITSEAARAHAELLQWEAFTDALEQAPDSGTRQVLTWLRDLFGFGLIEKHLAWYVIHGRLSPQRAQAVTAYIDRLITRIRPHAVDLVDAFGYGPELVRAKIATGIEADRQAEARAYYADLRASGDAPVEEKSLKTKKR